VADLAEAVPTRSAVVLRAQDISIARHVPGISLELRDGEILGLAGLEGHGQEVFLEVLAGLHAPVGGHLVVRDRRGAWRPVTDQRDATRYGVVYVPRDRKSEGILPSMSVLDNFAIAALSRFSTLGVLRRSEVSRAFAEARQRLGIVGGSERDPITTLSGGNQQKVLLARALALFPTVLALNDPTRGVDANAKQSFYQIFRSLATDDGVAIVVLSTEIRELVQLCDRALVFHQGALVAMCEGTTLTEQDILAGMFGRAAHSEPRT
jgi:ABC-type sugar transport system ATPase subunit